MEANGSYGTTWADQWDYSNPDPSYSENRRRSGGAFDKTRGAASTGMKKVKEGASVGVHWIKFKYQKRTTQKQ
ncbi:hypothetical protein RJ639_027303 [Escallonia herrerae]|uniref:Uncharacterized protein n=1 Tax=Escallonia herrerae TaxID=1293975 RepID=A0AA89BE35_9ASTE|nr:hypothetical protein RJ639_027303 [Escallonia herrerae]